MTTYLEALEAAEVRNRRDHDRMVVLGEIATEWMAARKALSDEGGFARWKRADDALVAYFEVIYGQPSHPDR